MVGTRLGQIYNTQWWKRHRQNQVLYCALYHAYIAPHLFEDANQEYYGADGNTHKAEDFERYTLFSLWDTFRTLHPLLTITEPEHWWMI